MNRIEWLTKSSQMYTAYYDSEDTQVRLKGGRLYEIEVIKMLAKIGLDIRINSNFIKQENILRDRKSTRRTPVTG